MALKLPTSNVSLVDLVVDLKTDVTIEKGSDALREASNGNWQDYGCKR